MRLYVQWTRAVPQDWEPVEVARVADWRGLPKKPAPSGLFDPTATTADDAGWVYATMCQGVSISGYDCYSVRIDPDGLVLIAWNEDPIDHPFGTRWAVEWTFGLPAVDARIGRVNTRQWLTMFREDNVTHDYGNATTGGAVAYRPWSEFQRPAENLTRYGIWMGDVLAQAHNARLMEPQNRRGWPEWAT